MTDAATLAEGRMYEFTTQSGADTVAVGRKLAGLLKPPQFLLLRGELGTGKTTLVKGIARAGPQSARSARRRCRLWPCRGCPTCSRIRARRRVQ